MKKLVSRVLEAIAILFVLGTALLTLQRRMHRQARTQLYQSDVNHMSGEAFENYIADLLPYQGFSHIVFTERYDRGIDIIARKDDVLWGIQIKRHRYSVKISAVRQVVAALNFYKCQKSMVITNSVFTRRAQELALSNNCQLVNGTELKIWSHNIR